MKYDELLFQRYFDDWSKLPADKIVSLLNVKTKTVIPSLKDIDFSKKLRVKWGIDPTGADLHIGHICSVVVINLFLKCGHHIDLVIGDFTARIGDPSGRSTERPMLTDAEITENMKTYKQQIGKYIDTDKVAIRFNSEWLNKMPIQDILYIFKGLKLAAALQREDFRTRLAKGDEVSIAEVFYASNMGFDSIALETDIEIGGIDQLLNFQQCREIQRIKGQKPEIIITTPLLEGTDGSGRKMGKSFGNYIAVNASAEEKFGKIMSIPDNVLMQYYKCFCYLYENEIADLEKFIETQPMEAKKQLAAYLVSIEARDLKAGLAERDKFEKKFSKRELAEDDFETVYSVHGSSLKDVLFSSGKFSSMGEVKRLFTSNAISDIATLEKLNPDMPVTALIKVKCGKLTFLRIIPKEVKS